MRKQIIIMLLIVSPPLFASTYKLVEHPFESGSHAYLKQASDKSWGIVIPNGCGYVWHPITNVQLYSDHVTFTYEFGNETLYYFDETNSLDHNQLENFNLHQLIFTQ